MTAKDLLKTINPSPDLNMSIPVLNAEEKLRNKQLKQIILDAIGQSESQTITFAEFMNLALYEPHHGYYSAAPNLVGPQGDFVTAPEYGSVFGDSVAKKLSECFSVFSGPREIYEFGAGNGTLAVQILRKMERVGCDIDSYSIVEVSPMMRQKQIQTIRSLASKAASKVTWIEQLPPTGINGMVIANEVLDAMPAELFLAEQNRVLQGYVVETADELSIEFREQVNSDFKSSFEALDLSDIPFPYFSELHCRAEAWMRTVAANIVQGSILLSDYGFPKKQYYHRDRSNGTLMCHRRHHAISNPLVNIGCQDITAHVNFSRIADVACDNGMQVNGFTSLAAFLYDVGEIHYDLEITDPRTRREVDVLISPSEMGEIFKVIELTKNFDSTIMGFETADRTYSLDAKYGQ